MTRLSTHLGKPVAILIDVDVVTAPTLKSPIGAAAVSSGGPRKQMRRGSPAA